MNFQLLVGIIAVLWLASIVACVVALRWTFLSVPRRFLAAVVLSLTAILLGYLGLTRFHVDASRTVNGQTQWRFDSKWFFIVTLVFAGATLIYSLWKQKRIARVS